MFLLHKLYKYRWGVGLGPWAVVFQSPLLHKANEGPLPTPLLSLCSLKTHPRAPAWALGDPADLRVANSAADPVTAVLLLHHDLALRAVHGLALLQHGLGQSRG